MSLYNPSQRNFIKQARSQKHKYGRKIFYIVESPMEGSTKPILDVRTSKRKAIALKNFLPIRKISKTKIYKVREVK